MDTGKEFAVCIFSGENSLLTPRKVYQILPDDSAARSDFVRIVDDEGEDYLYPKKYFVFVSVPSEAADSILEAA